jgi:hypothetical protein
MGIVGCACVVTFEPAAGMTLAAVWDGGRWCHVHVVEAGGYGPRLEAWDMHDKWHNAPQIECTPRALQQLVEWRLEDRNAVAEMVALATTILDGSGPPVFARHGVPQFSTN